MRLTPSARKWLPWLLLVAAVVVTAMVYWPGVTGGWVFDDFPNIVDNAAIHITWGHASLAAWVNAALSSPASFLHRPLASITFALNWMMGNGNPYPFKVTNIVIHVLNGVLLFCMLRALLRLLGLRATTQLEPLSLRERSRGEGTDSPDVHGLSETEPSPAPAGHPLPVGEGNSISEPSPAPAGHHGALGHGWQSYPEGEGKNGRIEDAAATRLALIVATAWLLLPINLMAVLYVVQRMESLCQVFVLAGLWAYLHGRWMMLTAADARTDRRGFVLAAAGIMLGTVLGLTSKETAVLLPVFAFLAEWVVIGFGRRRVLPRTTAPLVIPGLPAGQNPGSVDSNVGDEETTDSGSPLRGVRNDQQGASGGVRNDQQGASGGVWNDQQGASGGIRNDNQGVFGSAQNDKDETLRAAPQSFVIPGLPAGQNPGSVDSNVGDEEATDSGSPLRGVRNDQQGASGGVWNDEQEAWRGSTPSRSGKRIWALFTIVLFIPAVLGFLWQLRAALSAAAYSGRNFTLAQRLLTEPRVLVDYLHWTIFPNPEVLSLYHDEIVKSTGLLAPWTTLGAMLLLAALIAVAVWLRKRRPLVALGIGWFFAAQLLTATFIPLELVYEQRMYFASIGVLLVLGSLLLGMRWRIHWGLLRGFLVAAALVWFGTATLLRAQEWSDPITLATTEADRHPESARAVYEAGRLLLIASNYRPGTLLDEATRYLREAAAIPGASTLPEQALLMIVDHERHGDDEAYWQSMTRKLRDQPTRQEDISALISLTNCYGSGICRFDAADLQRAYEAVLSRPHPIARLYGAYANFQRDLLHDDTQAIKYLALAVQGAPAEPAYRVDLAALYARNGRTDKAVQQIDALRRMNLAGRLDRQIAVLERLAKQSRASH